MSKNNSANLQPSASSDHKMSALSIKQCSPDFTAQLASGDHHVENWLSIYPIVSQIITHFTKLPQPLLIINSRSWEAAIAVTNETLPDNFQSLALQNYNQQTLFGRLNIENDILVNFAAGEIANHQNGCLILHISPLLVSPHLWFLLKAFLLNRTVPASSAVNSDKLKGPFPDPLDNEINTKVIIIANRFQLDELAQIDPEYSQVDRLFTELSSDIDTTDSNIQSLKFYCQRLIKQSQIHALTDDAMALLFHHLSSLCEHQRKILFSPRIIENLLRYAQLLNPEKPTISALEIQNVLDLQDQSHSLAQSFSDQAIIEKQLRLQLKGAEIGQINGMSVVELMGYPNEFGEIFRISASDMLGDGEIIDVERKVDFSR
ncbi:AAA family ATPase [Psychromonas sp. MME1]|uniref:AAA family ATPase n=1 Tax=Psychromonas sp. MME1 TaxID=3231032 RepID=UPI0034E2E607